MICGLAMELLALSVIVGGDGCIGAHWKSECPETMLPRKPSRYNLERPPPAPEVMLEIRLRIGGMARRWNQAGSR
jgi:hypothetical protein